MYDKIWLWLDTPSKDWVDEQAKYLVVSFLLILYLGGIFLSVILFLFFVVVVFYLISDCITYIIFLFFLI